MEKICRSVTTLYRLPRINRLNLITSTPVTSQANYNGGHYYWSQPTITMRHYSSQKPPANPGLSGARIYGDKHESTRDEQPKSIVEILDREIQEESAELNQHLATDQFPGFSVETDEADVTLTKQVKNATVTVRFTVSSSLNEWPSDTQDQQQQGQQNQEEDMTSMSTTLVSMPEFQVQITKANRTLELSCYFEDMEQDEETGEPFGMDPIFSIDELVIYENSPKETVFAVSAEFFEEDLQSALLDYLGEYGINDEFSKNLVGFATKYEKKLYVNLMKRLKSFVADE